MQRNKPQRETSLFAFNDDHTFINTPSPKGFNTTVMNPQTAMLLLQGFQAWSVVIQYAKGIEVIS